MTLQYVLDVVGLESLWVTLLCIDTDADFLTVFGNHINRIDQNKNQKMIIIALFLSVYSKTCA